MNDMELISSVLVFLDQNGIGINGFLMLDFESKKMLVKKAAGQYRKEKAAALNVLSKIKEE